MLEEAVQDRKTIDKAVADLEKISGQKVLITRARKSVASFKIREGMPIGVKVTLRRERMYEFLDRLINIALPRVRDFRGLNRNHLMAMVTIVSVSKSKLSSLKLIMTR